MRVLDSVLYLMPRANEIKPIKCDYRTPKSYEIRVQGSILFRTNMPNLW